MITSSNNNNNDYDDDDNNNNRHLLSISSFKNINNTNNNNNNNNNNIKIRGEAYLCLLISKTPGSRVSRCMQCRTVRILNPAVRRKSGQLQARSKKPPRKELVGPQGHCTHTSESTNIKVQNLFHLQSNITCSTNSKYRTAATLKTVETWFVSCM